MRDFRAAAADLKDNHEQWQAYESTGNCVILAGPGSGKTKTITIKLARLVAEDLSRPQRVACITYSNACVGELRTRLADLGVDDEAGVRISTVHSFCLTEVVEPFGRIAGMPIPDPIAIASQATSTRLFKQACKRALRNENPGNWFRLECDRLRRNIPDKRSQAWRDSNATQDKAAVLAYEALLRENNLLDFDGIVLTALELIEQQEWVRNVIRARYPVLFIDEYQDLGLPLHRIVVALMKSGVRIVAVGDPDQSIYGFTGAQPVLLRRLAQREGVTAIRLKLNYRCAPEIISASALLLQGANEFRASSKRKGVIRFYRLETDVEGQAEMALQKIVPRLLKANPTWAPADIAFLYRSHHEGSAIASVADALGIKYYRADNGAPIPRTPLTGLLIPAAKWCAQGGDTEVLTLRQVTDEWRRLRRTVRNEKDLFAERADFVSMLFELRAPEMRLSEWLQRVHAGGIGRLLAQDPTLVEDIDVFAKLLKDSARGGALADYTVSTFGEQGRQPQLLNLITLHSSKGLEFEAVIMVGIEQGLIPHANAKSQEEIDEARRLFYVGVTRAKTEVHLLYDKVPSPLITKIRSSTEG